MLIRAANGAAGKFLRRMHWFHQYCFIQGMFKFTASVSPEEPQHPLITILLAVIQTVVDMKLVTLAHVFN